MARSRAATLADACTDVHSPDVLPPQVKKVQIARTDIYGPVTTVDLGLVLHIKNHWDCASQAVPEKTQALSFSKAHRGNDFFHGLAHYLTKVPVKPTRPGISGHNVSELASV